MSVVEKLLIKGIRSFSPENDKVIDFSRPLTVIVGQNGAGKTTVIECLKMATTGSLPPNTRSGQSFIHDPKIANEVEVKACIKFRFRTAQQTRIVCSRYFQLTQARSKLQYKALDQTIQTINKETREKEAVSHRCVDMDRIVPTLMGVSKAILENVIFVHQEESNWPLEEGAVLKKKFDEIFSATKYTKALEALHKVRKEHLQSVKEMKLKMETLQSRMDQALKYRDQVSVGEGKVQKLKQKIEELRAEVAAVEGKKLEVEKKLDAIADLGEKMSSVGTKLEERRQQSEAMLEELGGEPEESVDWIRQKQQQLQETVDSMQQAATGLEEAVAQRSEELEAARTSYRSQVERQGRLQGEADAHAANVTKRDALVRELAGRTGMAALPAEGPLDRRSVEAFVESIGQRADGLARELESLKAENEATAEAASEKVSKLDAEIAAAREATASKAQRKERIDSDLERLEAESARIAMSDEMLRERDEEVERCEQQLAAANDRNAQEGFEAKLRESGDRLTEIGRSITRLREERKTVEAVSESATRIRYKTRELHDTEEKARALMESRRRDLLKLLGADGSLPPAEQLHAAAQEEVRGRRAEAERSARAKEEAQAKVTNCAARKDSADHQLASLKRRAEELWRQVLDGLDEAARQTVSSGESLEKLITQRQSHKATKEARLTQLEAHSQILDVFVQEAHSDNQCGLCGRSFSGPEKQQFLDRQSEMMERLPGAIHRKQQEVSQAEEALEAVSKLQPLWLSHQNARQELLEAEPRAAMLAAELGALQEKATQAEDEHRAARESLDFGARLLEEVTSRVDSLAREAARHREEVARLERQSAGISPARSVADVDSELDGLEKEQDRIRRERDGVSERQASASRQIQSLSASLYAAKEEAQRARGERKEKDRLLAQIRALEEEQAAVSGELSALESRRGPLEKARAAAAEEREEIRRSAARGEARAEEELRRFQGMSDDVRRLSEPIGEYESLGKAAELEAARSKISELEQEISARSEAVKEAEARLSSKGEELLKREAVLRQMKDALQYKLSIEKEAELEAELRSLRAEAGAIGDQAALIEEMKARANEIRELEQRINMQRGSVATEEAAIQSAKQSLREPQYLRIDERCREQQIEQTTTEMAARDLERYHKALEKALQTFHSNKMADINKIVKELWQKTYRNQDIDYIMIKSDADGLKSYNYRVVMVCQGIELDMRGRCSAGQKVLACLIIRLALAETFCLNCGILALDEPTTNLDADNAAGLAEALRRLIDDRQEQENFQLIVITHDERFASLIGTREYVEKRWRVTKDENQHSLLQQEEVSD